MTYKETLESWEKIFILVMESTEDPVYQKAEEILKKPVYQNALKSIIEDEIPLPWAIGFYVCMILIESVGPDKLSTLGEEEIVSRIDDFWNRYLKRPTRVFTTKNGITPITTSSLKVGLKIYKKNYEEF